MSSSPDISYSPSRDPIAPIGGKFQEDLSEWQTFPILGPLVVSPIKLLFSVTQVIAALAAALFASIAFAGAKLCTMMCYCTLSSGPITQRIKAVIDAALKEELYNGSEHALSSIINLCSLGFLDLGRKK